MPGLSLIRIMFVVALGSLCVVAQAQQSGVGGEKAETPPGTGVITGRVVNESGQALPFAMISVHVAGASGYSQSVASDREGKFQVEGLDPKLSYYVNASMAAYSNLGRDWPRTAPPTYRPGDSVTLTLTKGGVITGRVTNAAGDPLVGIRVRVERVRQARNGQRLFSGWVNERETDDRGIYRIYGLPAGSYLVQAGGAGQSYSSANVDPYDTDVPTYAPSSTRQSANEISVSAGEEVTGVDISYRGEQGRVISGVVGAPVGENEGVSVVLAAVGGNDSESGMGTRFPEMNGRSFSYIGVAEGDYNLYAYSYSKTREFGLSDIKRINVRGADVTGIELTPRPLGSVAGRVALDETTPPECTDKSRPSFEGITVGGWHNDNEAAKEIPQTVWGYGSPVKPDAQGNFVVRNLAPGEYYFITRTAAKNWYVRSVQFSSAGQKKPIDATRAWTNLKFGEKLSGLAITLAPGAASFRGQLALDEGGKAPARTFIYLAPVERERADNPLSYFGTPVTPDGKIAMNNIAPGRYWIYAQTVEEDAPVPLMRVRFPHENEIRSQIRRVGEAAKTEIEFKPCQNVENYKLSLTP